MKIINWQTSTIVFLGLFIGTFLGATHSLQLNFTINYYVLVVTHVILPLVVIFLALIERSKKKLSYLIGVMMASFLIGWEVMLLILERYFFDEVVWGCLVVTIVYIAIALGINFLKDKIKTRKTLIIIISAFLLLELGLTAYYCYSAVKEEKERRQRSIRELQEIGRKMRSEGFPEDFKNKKTDNK
jgi:hydrogenase maturation factor